MGKPEWNPDFVRRQILGHEATIRRAHIDRRFFGELGGVHANKIREANGALRTWKARRRQRGAK